MKPIRTPRPRHHMDPVLLPMRPQPHPDITNVIALYTDLLSCYLGLFAAYVDLVIGPRDDTTGHDAPTAALNIIRMAGGTTP